MSVVAVPETLVRTCVPCHHCHPLHRRGPLATPEMAWRAGALVAGVLHDIQIWGQPRSW